MEIFPHRTLEALAATLAANLINFQQESCDPFEPVTIISPSKTFTDWIQIEIAKQSGLCMGLNFLPVGQFLGPLTGRNDSWSPKEMTWRVLPLVNQYAGALGVTNPSMRDRLALARVIADQFDLYAHYRPELIEKWTHGQPVGASPHEPWQRELWGKVAAGKLHPVLDFAGRTGDLPLIVVGAGTLDPLLVDFLSSLPASCHVEVHVCLPSLEYLGDLKTTLPTGRRAPEMTRCDPELFETHPGHPLLMSMGRKSIGVFHLLGKLDTNYHRWPEPLTPAKAGKASLLNQIQDDIRQLNANPSANANAPERDLSVRVHSCFGPRREMEVLRDELLRAFNDLPGLKPEEVLIVTPSLDTYAPLVSAVLEQPHKGETQKGQLSVRLTQLPPAEQSPVAEAILALLEIVHSALFEASSLLELLELRAVRTCLEISDQIEALEPVRDWIRDSGLTRGLGQSHSDVGSWQFAADRLTAGNWLGAEQTAKYPSAEFVLPVANDLGGDRALRQRVLLWMERLRQIFNQWQQPASPPEWAQRLSQATLELLVKDIDAEEEDVHLEIQRQLDFLSKLECQEPLDAGAMFDWLTDEFEQAGLRSLMTGQIAFGEFKHLQHIPCRVLAMVGMQEGQFPRPNKMPAWSLLRLEPKIWDRNARVDDRQLFLDALLTTSDRLIITASSQNVRSGKSEPFSVCVDELLRVAELMGHRRDQLVIKHRLQPFAQGYFESGPLPLSFDTRNHAVATALSKDGTGKTNPFWQGTPQDQPPPQFVSLDELVRFWKDPAKAYLRSQGIETYEEDAHDDELNRTPLKLSGLTKWQAMEAVIRDGLGENADLDFTHARLLAGRGLPPGEFGQQIWTDLKAKGDAIVQAIKALTDRELRAVEVDLASEGCSVRGMLRLGQHAQKQLLLSYRAGEFKSAGHFLEPWIQALLAAAAGVHAESRLFGEDGVKELPAIDPHVARQSLVHLVHGFLEGRTRPLCYAPATSEKYLLQATKAGEPNLSQLQGAEVTALRIAAKEWHNDNGHGGEGASATSLLAWRDRDSFEEPEQWHQWACHVAQPLRAWANQKTDEDV